MGPEMRHPYPRLGPVESASQVGCGHPPNPSQSPGDYISANGNYATHFRALILAKDV